MTMNTRAVFNNRDGFISRLSHNFYQEYIYIYRETIVSRTVIKARLVNDFV